MVLRSEGEAAWESTIIMTKVTLVEEEAIDGDLEGVCCD